MPHPQHHAQPIADAVREAENIIDQAIAGVARATSVVVEARLGTGVPAALGAAVFGHLAQVQASLAAARDAAVASHRELDRVGKHLGVSAIAAPGVPKPEEDGEIPRRYGKLSAVA